MKTDGRQDASPTGNIMGRVGMFMAWAASSTSGFLVAALRGTKVCSAHLIFAASCFNAVAAEPGGEMRNREKGQTV